MSFHVHVPHDPSDPLFNPGRPNASTTTAPKPVAFDWVKLKKDQLNLLLNAVNYRAGHTSETSNVSPAIDSAEHARTQLLRKDLVYRFRLREIAWSKKHKDPDFEKNVRLGMRWRGWEPAAPWYTYLGDGAHTPTDAEHQAYVTRTAHSRLPDRVSTSSASASSSSADRVVIDLVNDTPPPAVGAAVQTGVVIPPKPILPPHPHMNMPRPKGPLYPTKHPFTEAETKAMYDKNRVGYLKTFLKKLYDADGSPHNGYWMYKAMVYVCYEMDPATACLKKEEWLQRVLEDLQWQGYCKGFTPRIGNENDGVKILSAAYANTIRVFTPLDDGLVPKEFTTPEAVKKYTEIKTKFDADMKVYEAAQKQLKEWQNTYGALADTIIPPALDPNDKDVEMTAVNMLGSGKTAVEERKRKAIATTMCIDCDNPQCECVELTKSAPKIVKTEPSSSSAASASSDAVVGA